MSDNDCQHLIEIHHIPKTTVAALAQVFKTELSLFFRYPASLPRAKQERIRAAVADVLLLADHIDLLRTECGLDLQPNWRNTESVRVLIQYLKDPAFRRTTDEASLAKVLEHIGAQPVKGAPGMN